MARVPFDFVLEEIQSRSPYIKHMFGCVSVYVDDQIVLFLRDRADDPGSNGVWVATTTDHIIGLAEEFDTTAPLEVQTRPSARWLLIPAGKANFERDTLRACELIAGRDPRIGHVPKRGRSRKPKRA